MNSRRRSHASSAKPSGAVPGAASWAAGPLRPATGSEDPAVARAPEAVPGAARPGVVAPAGLAAGVPEAVREAVAPAVLPGMVVQAAHRVIAGRVAARLEAAAPVARAVAVLGVGAVVPVGQVEAPAAADPVGVPVAVLGTVVPAEDRIHAVMGRR